MSNRRIVLCFAIALVAQGIAACALWRHWGLDGGVRAATESGDLFRYVCRTGFILTAFPLLAIFEYLVVRALIAKDGVVARLIFSLYGKS